MGSDGEGSVETARRRTDGERQAIVIEAFREGAVVGEVAERHKVSAASIYLWRRQLREAAADKARKAAPSPVTLMPVQIVQEPEAPMSNAPARAERIEIALVNGRILRVCESIDPARLVRLVAALESTAP